MRCLVKRVALLVLVVVALAGSTPAAGQLWESYAAKFVCGSRTVSPAPLPEGVYKTIVNIHNPNYLVLPGGPPVPLLFFKKIVLAQVQGQVPLPPSCKLQELLEADRAMFVDCTAIKRQLSISGLPATGPLEGFVVLEVPSQPDMGVPVPPLDVVAVYAGRPRQGTLDTLDVERVPPTVIVGEPVQDPCAPD